MWWFSRFRRTITTRDATDAILEALRTPGWLAIEEAWVTGQIGSRECLAAQIALVTASEEQVNHLLDTIDLDPGFSSLLDVCAAERAAVHHQRRIRLLH